MTERTTGLSLHLSSVLCPLSSVLCPLSSVLCPLSSDICPLSRPEPLLLEALVHVGDKFGVAVEQERGLALAAGADDLLGRLAPARVRHLRVHVRPETIFLVLQRFPVALGALVREIEPG